MSDGGDGWKPFDGGRSVGQLGSEGGVILVDDEFDGARITIERDCSSAPFAISCGVYGWMVHTRFFSSAAEAQNECAKMKVALIHLTEILDVDDLDAAGRACSDFVSAFP